MDRVQIKANPRPGFGKGCARQERLAGRVPAVVYHGGKEAIHFCFETKEFTKALSQGRNTLFQLDLSAVGQPGTLALVKEIQRHPTRPGYLHIDFLAVEPTSTVVVDVPFELVGNPEGVRLGGKLRRHERSAKLSCKADSIPAGIGVDVSALMPGETMLMSRVVPPPATKLIFRYDLPVVSVSTLAAAQEGAEGAPAAAAEAPAAAPAE